MFLLVILSTVLKFSKPLQFLFCRIKKKWSIFFNLIGSFFFQDTEFGSHGDDLYDDVITASASGDGLEVIFLFLLYTDVKKVYSESLIHVFHV